MLPKSHIILGAVFSILVKLVFPDIGWFYIGLMFLATFLIDFDHYAFAVMKTRNLSLINALRWFKNRIKEERGAGRIGLKARRSPFFLLHTVEFHLLVLLMGYFWIGFFYIFAGMVFHSLADFVNIAYRKELHCRWFFATEWLIKRHGKE